MKIILFLFILLAACTQQVPVLDEVKETDVPETNKTINVTVNPDISSKNFTLTKNNSTMKKINNVDYRIEIIDVTEAADACLIKVNGELVIINEGSTRKINGLRIFVADVKAFRSQTEDNDVCRLVIA